MRCAAPPDERLGNSSPKLNPVVSVPRRSLPRSLPGPPSSVPTWSQTRSGFTGSYPGPTRRGRSDRPISTTPIAPASAPRRSRRRDRSVHMNRAEARLPVLRLVDGSEVRGGVTSPAYGALQVASRSQLRSRRGSAWRRASALGRPASWRGIVLVHARRAAETIARRADSVWLAASHSVGW